VGTRGVQAPAMAVAIRHILCPIDFSELTPPVVGWAAHLAATHGARVTLLHAYHLPVEFQQLEGAYLPPEFWSSVKEEAQQGVARHAEPLRARGIEVDEEVREGYPASVITEAAEELGADLIVIGTHGLTGIRHLLLGSIAERVIQRAPCPVLTVKAPRGSSEGS